MLDVAHVAGVSRALVSIVLRDAPGASAATREHVRKVASELGYVPDARARALRAQEVRSIGIAFRADQPFHTSMLDALYRAADAQRRPVVLSAMTGERDEHRAVEALVANRCGALVLLEPHLPVDELLRVAHGLPLVSVAEAIEHEAIDCVVSDDADGMAQAVRYLHALGHRCLWFAESSGSGGNAERVEAFLRVSQELGLTHRVVPGGNVEAAGVPLARRWLDESTRPTAVICFNDACVSGLQDVLVRAGVALPEDLSIIGFDDSPTASLPYRELTTVRQDMAALGREAMDLALRRMSGQEEASTIRRLPVELVLRGSTRAPRD